MRGLPFLLCCFLFFSCGKNSLPSSRAEVKHPQTDEYGTTINDIDLLDVAIDVPIEISMHKIYFKQSETQIAEGMHSECELNVRFDESYDFKLTDNLLEIKSENGPWRKFVRISGNFDSLIGTWTNKTNDGAKMIMSRMTFVSEERLIIRSHCES